MKKLLAMLLLLVGVLASQAVAKEVKVEGYTKKDGTKVAGYTKTVKDKKDSDTTEVQGYTRKDGTKVKGYTRKKTPQS